MTQEIYALSANRSSDFVRLFLAEFLKEYSVFADEFPVPECADNPDRIFTTEGEILEFLEKNPHEPYGLYWNARSEGDVAQAMVFYTRDRHAIYGIAVQEGAVEKWRSALMSFLGAKISLLGTEQRPPETADEFAALCDQ